MRERGASSALPPLYFLHVWWARRPLTTSRAAILASVLPSWSERWPARLKKQFPTEDGYHAWFLKACGIFGDPVAGRKLIAWAKERGVQLRVPPYSHSRAFTVSPSPEIQETIGDLLEHTWGVRRLSMLDPFAGGGSIPFEAMRYGFETIANELNPVACVILKATLEYPREFGAKLAEDLHKYGTLLAERVRKRLEPFFPVGDGESVHAFVWARTVRCPYTGKPIPLSPNWWLQKGSEPVAVRPVFEAKADEARFDIVRGKSACERLMPDKGTVRRGDAISPWAQNQPVDGDYIKSEAQSGRLGEQLYALAIKGVGGLAFRSPAQADLAAIANAQKELSRRLPAWEAKGWVPREPRKEGRADWAAEIYGIRTWADTFAPRQLLSMLTCLDALEDIAIALRGSVPAERRDAVLTYLGLAIDKAVDYNSRQVSWDTTRQKIRNAFTRHDFSFKWSPAEFDAARNLLPWVVDQVCDAYRGIAALTQRETEISATAGDPAGLVVRSGNAMSLGDVRSARCHLVCADPPYYDNVMYAELSDYFYVWMKRTLGGIHPALFREELTNKDDEVVANAARFKETGAKRHLLARADYQRKMTAAFHEARRLLHDDGVLTIMFTHKEADAWDTLATSLIGAGFSIRASWPVHTESEHSTHQARRNAAQSTILLTCRIRTESKEPVWWDDIKGRVREAARQKAAEFEKQGIRGVDLYIATFGPTLAILSENWPVLTSEVDDRTGKPKPLRPEVALDLAREEVISLRKQGLLLGRMVQFDPFTDWYLMAWDAFQAEEFPADEARKLALALGLDLEGQVISEKRLVSKKGSTVVLQQPKMRRRKNHVDPDKDTFECWIDAAHTAMLLYEEDGGAACQAFLRRTGLNKDGAFRSCLQALLNAIPRTKTKGSFVRPEAKVLDDMRSAFFDDLTVPPEEKPEETLRQLEYLPKAAPADDEADEDDEDGDD